MARDPISWPVHGRSAREVSDLATAATSQGPPSEHEESCESSDSDGPPMTRMWANGHLRHGQVPSSVRIAAAVGTFVDGVPSPASASPASRVAGAFPEEGPGALRAHASGDSAPLLAASGHGSVTADGRAVSSPARAQIRGLHAAGVEDEGRLSFRWCAVQ